MAFNLTHSSIVVSHIRSWHHRSTPERTLSTKGTPHGACLLPDRTGLWAKKRPIPQTLTELQNIHKWIKAGLSYLTKTGWESPKRLLAFEKKHVSYISLSQSWLTHHCKRDFGWLPRNSVVSSICCTFWKFLTCTCGLLDSNYFPSQIFEEDED